jgi:galactose-1-phosphate uridylyltransferase
MSRTIFNYYCNGNFGEKDIKLTEPGRRAWQVKELQTFFEMLDRSGPKVLIDMKKHKWLWRCFFNLTPSFIELPSNCVILASHPEYHYLYLDQMPPTVVASMVEGWKLWEGYVEWLNSKENVELRVLPFVNGGKRPEAGQSMFCFHSQVYFTPVPKLFEKIKEIREEKAPQCPLCSIINRKKNNSEEKVLEIYRNDTISLCMHPAPLRNFAMIAIPYRRGDEDRCSDKKESGCSYKIKDLRNSDVADVLQRSISIYRRLMGKVPAYNISVRCGPEVGHLHIQIVPKTETNILAGYEDITRQIIITQDPEGTADTLKRRYA